MFLPLGPPDCFSHTAGATHTHKKSKELKKFFSWTGLSKKKHREVERMEENGIPRWICMVMCENNDQQDTCQDTRLSQSLDLGLLHKDESDMTGEGVGISQAEQASPGSKPSMPRRYRNRSHSVQPDNFLGVEKLMGRRKSDSTSHKFAVDGKETMTHKSSVLSENSTTSNRRGALTFEASALGPLSPRIMTRGHFGLKV